MEYDIHPNQKFINFLDTMTVLYCLVIIYLCDNIFTVFIDDIFKAIGRFI